MTKVSIRKHITCLALSIIALIAALQADLPAPFSFVLAWDTFGITYVAMSIYIFASLNQHQIRLQCAKEDVSSWVLFALVVAACLTSLTIVLTVIHDASRWNIRPLLGSASCIVAIGIAWIMVHTSFAFRYAHLFYGDENKHFSKHAKGIIFPEDSQPDYFDFAYFSFVIGMTFQVSDVVITAKGVRRLVLIHSLIAFVFNTVIIALTVSQLVNFGAG